MKKSPEHFLKIAVELAVKNAKKGLGPFGCLIVRDGKILARGVNCVQTKKDPTAHAEIVAIRKACKKLGMYELKGCEVFCSSYPCLLCIGALQWARPEKVYYFYEMKEASTVGFHDELYYKDLISGDLTNLPLAKLEIPDAIDPFVVWKNNPKSELY